MSNVSSPQAAHGAGSVPDLSSLVHALQAAIQALTVWNRKFFPDRDLPDGVDGPAAPLAEPGETRRYFLFPELLREEKELLAEARVRDIPELLEKVHGRIFAVAALMKNVDLETQVSGYAVQLFGEHLEQQADLLLRAWNVMDDMELTGVSAVE